MEMPPPFTWKIDVQQFRNLSINQVGQWINKQAEIKAAYLMYKSKRTMYRSGLGKNLAI